jgi:DNA-binding NarL/FixJ family response regulator
VSAAGDADKAQLLQALRMGVRGYLLKSAAPEELVDALMRLALAKP